MVGLVRGKPADEIRAAAPPASGEQDDRTNSILSCKGLAAPLTPLRKASP